MGYLFIVLGVALCWGGLIILIYPLYPLKWKHCP